MKIKKKKKKEWHEICIFHSPEAECIQRAALFAFTSVSLVQFKTNTFLVSLYIRRL